MKKNIDTIILTYNEHLHIRRVVENAKLFSNNVFVLDSFSTDDTIQIAKECGAFVLQNEWHNNHAEQLNWGLRHFPFSADWILRLDADEYLTKELIEEIQIKLNIIPQDVSGIIFNRRTYFMGKWVKHGVYPVKLLRLFRKGKAVCEYKWMDEHIVLTVGKAIEFSHDFIDENLNNINWWIQKHNNYAVREAVDYFNMVYKIYEPSEKRNQLDKRRQKKYLYYKMPLFIRSFFYFCYRFFIKLAFLDGKQGIAWSFLQAYWYRFLVDCQIFEISQKCGNDRKKIKNWLKENYNISL